MAKTAKKKTASKTAAKAPKSKKAAPVKAVSKASKPAAKKAAPKATRRSAADVAKLQKAILKGLKAKKSAAELAEELGISRPYVYTLGNKG